MRRIDDGTRYGRNRQFRETTLILDADSPCRELWIKGASTGKAKIFGTLKVSISRGPEGFGIEISRSAGDAPLRVSFNGEKVTADDVFVYELTEAQAIKRGWVRGLSAGE